jgi:MoxR-like ATPase
MSKISTAGYKPKHFSPEKRVHRVKSDTSQPRDDRVYVYSDEIVFAVNVAIATRRPLLVRGESGSGKSSLARNVADVLGWRYFEHVVTSRTEARDLLWDVDLVRRLHTGAALTSDFTPFIAPGPLWWAFDRGDAQRRGAPDGALGVEPVPDPHPEIKSRRAVVLLDEIDKADPDVPNNLLQPLGSLEFVVEETQHKVTAEASQAPLIFLTTNEERELPPAFLRRCVEVRLEQPDPDGMVEIAQAHYPDIDVGELRAIAGAVLGTAKISTAEFLDTVQAKIDLGVALDGPTWALLKTITAIKPGR